MTWKNRKTRNRSAIQKAKAETDKWCSRYVRCKAACDLDPFQRLGRCYTCGIIKDVKDMDSGHYKSRGIGGKTGLYFNVKAIRLQCKRCNGMEQGRPAEFREELIREYGEAEVQHLEIIHKCKTYTLREIIGLGMYFRDEVRDMIETQSITPWWPVKHGHLV